MKNKKIIFIILVIIFSVSGIIFYHKSQEKYNGKTEIKVVSARNLLHYGTFEYNEELYSKTAEGIVKYTENNGKSLIVMFDNENSDYTVYNEKIYLVSNEDNGAFLSVYDMNGTQISEKQALPVDELYSIGISKNYLIGCTNHGENEIIFRAFDMNDDFKEVNISFNEFNERNIPCYSYGTEYIYAAYSEFDKIICNTDYIRSTSDFCIAANEKYFVYDPNPMPSNINYIDLSSGSFKSINGLTKYDMFNENSMITLADLNGNSLIVTYRENKQGRIDLRELNDTDRLSEHEQDFYVVFDLTSGNTQKKHFFKKYERIIYADSDKIMTCKNGKCITYSADDFSKLSEQDIDFIAEDKTYYFYSETNNIYILDEKRENLLGKLSIK